MSYLARFAFSSAMRTSRRKASARLGKSGCERRHSSSAARISIPSRNTIENIGRSWSFVMVSRITDIGQPFKAVDIHGIDGMSNTVDITWSLFGMASVRGPRPDLAEMNRKRAKHGLADSKVYNLWRGMMRRCYDEKNKDYPRYGGREIGVCDRWHSVENFVADMGAPAAGMSLERINNNRGYSPDNCRWASPSEQSRNRRSNVLLTHDGLTLTVAEWSTKVGIERKTLEYRIRAGWEAARALTTPSLINRKAA